MKMADRITKIVKTNGSWSVKKILIALMIPLTMFVLTTAYGRYSWIRDQCYKVATHEKALMQTKEALITKDAFLEALISKNNGILHSRANKEQDKRERGDERLMDLFIKILDSQQKSVELQKESVQKQENFYQEQRTNGNK
ncbi:MAG: hypothetical protein GQ553_03955 [Nitrosomonadaceae bacterium]|nr:hypothetical protein [Nitrosomonadaceae bacterium]